MTVAVFGFILISPRAASAGPQCDSVGGECNAVCGYGQDLGDQDCKLPQTCCKTTTPECESAGGKCSPVCGLGNDLGDLGCKFPQSCCKVAAPTPAAQGEPAAEEKATPSFDRLVLPACTKTGNCTVNDIIQTGVNFASFLMGLSGGLFLIVFIYGGAMYLLSFGDKARVDKGKKAIRGAAFGIIIVMGSWAIVQTIYSTLVPAGGGGKSSDKKKTCTDLGEGWACKQWTGKTAAAVQQEASKAGFNCQTGYCVGDFHNVCCKSK